MIIAITGKIGSGKSTLARSLAAQLSPYGYTLLDVDALTARLYADPTFQLDIQAIFGTVDRQAISRACFSNPTQRLNLERVSSPLWTMQLTAELLKPNLIVDFPLLMETQLAAPSIDLAVGVCTHDEIRQERACQRLGWDAARFAAVDALQVGQRAKMSFCDLSLSNNGELDQWSDPIGRIASGIRDLDHIKIRIEPFVGVSAWRMITRAHMQSHRRYHGPAHLRALFDALDFIAPELSTDISCALAICYHDFVYETGPTAADNEHLSARVLSSHAREFFPHLLSLPQENSDFSSVALACAMVDATKGHQITDPWLLGSPKRLARTQAFLDADLAILGYGSDHHFWAYDKAISEEYASVPRPDYHRLRAQVMLSLTDSHNRPHLYFTQAAQVWEPVARRRVAALIDKHHHLATLDMHLGSML